MAQTNIPKEKRLRRKLKEPCEIGWCELIDLPGLGVKNLHAKVDTGAGTSSLHATRIKPFEKDGQNYVQFTIPMGTGIADYHCEARVYGRRRIKSSNGVMQTRYVIETVMKLGPLEWVGHMTLANRQSMIFPVLIGRRALKRGFLVNSAKRWMLGRHEER
ncbi:ATP-dependent zinc protease [Parasphingorhabdus sp.]|uniref:ATP-dependent zinc protease family protein n=1 Tax=Parasphingorhabdus sp. TaxID=2709688 RepID=UPI003C711041